MATEDEELEELEREADAAIAAEEAEAAKAETELVDATPPLTATDPLIIDGDNSTPPEEKPEVEAGEDEAPEKPEASSDDPDPIETKPEPQVPDDDNSIYLKDLPTVEDEEPPPVEPAPKVPVQALTTARRATRKAEREIRERDDRIRELEEQQKHLKLQATAYGVELTEQVQQPRLIDDPDRYAQLVDEHGKGIADQMLAQDQQNAQQERQIQELQRLTGTATTEDVELEAEPEHGPYQSEENRQAHEHPVFSKWFELELKGHTKAIDTARQIEASLPEVTGESPDERLDRIAKLTTAQLTKAVAPSKNPVMPDMNSLPPNSGQPDEITRILAKTDPAEVLTAIDNIRDPVMKQRAEEALLDGFGETHKS